MTTEEANKKIAELLEEAEAKLNEAAQIADEHGVSFSWDGPTYGMGGYYTAKRIKNDSNETDNNNNDDDDWESSDDGWQSSSQGC